MQDDLFCLYPIYMDSTRSISRGRRYPLSVCIKKPTFLELVKGLQMLGIEHQADPTKKHPRDPFICGRVHVNKKYEKRYVVEGVLKVISDQRNAKQEIQKVIPEKTQKVQQKNPLNLVVRRKKRKEKK